MKNFTLTRYLFKIWITTVLLSPVMLILLDKLHYSIEYGSINVDVAESASVMFFLLFMGIVLSLPVMLVIVLLSAFTIEKITCEVHKKIVLTIAVLVLGGIILWLGLQDDMENIPRNRGRLLLLFTPYLYIPVIGIWLFNIKPINKIITGEPT